jgi:predicted outer membrane repeat protein
MRNQGFYGGAIFGGQESTVHVVESMFESNQAIIAGGAYANEGYSNSRFENCKFRYNSASSGGAVYNTEFSDAKIFGNIFDENLAVEGGAIFNGGRCDAIATMFSKNFAEDSVSLEKLPLSSQFVE